MTQLTYYPPRDNREPVTAPAPDGRSTGTRDCTRRAHAAGIPVHEVTA